MHSIPGYERENITTAYKKLPGHKMRLWVYTKLVL